MHARLSEGFLRALREYFCLAGHFSKDEIQVRTGVYVPTIQKGWINVARNDEERQQRVLRRLDQVANIIEYRGPVFEPGCRLNGRAVNGSAAAD